MAADTGYSWRSYLGYEPLDVYNYEYKLWHDKLMGCYRSAWATNYTNSFLWTTPTNKETTVNEIKTEKREVKSVVAASGTKFEMEEKDGYHLLTSALYGVRKSDPITLSKSDIKALITLLMEKLN